MTFNNISSSSYLQRRNVDGWAEPGQQNVAGNLANDVSHGEGCRGVVQFIAEHDKIFLPTCLSDANFSLDGCQFSTYIPDTNAFVIYA
jgi:hypothetical protein